MLCQRDEQCNTKSPSEETNIEHRQSELLKKSVDLLSLGVFESDSSFNQRLAVLNRLKEIASRIAVKIQMSCSIRFNAHLPGVDIDAICVAPQNINRNIFVDRFTDELSLQPNFEKLQVIEDPYAPFIEVTIDATKVRLTIASFEVNEIPEDINMLDVLVQTLDVQSFWSFRDCREMKVIHNEVFNVEDYCVIFRFSKLWAEKRRIYSPAFTYFGCYYSWARQVAYFCSPPQCAPHSTTYHILLQFFSSFLNNKWASRKKIRTTAQIMQIPNIYSGEDTVSNIMKRFILHEFKRAARMMKRILHGSMSWDEFFCEPNFFNEYDNFLVLLVWSPSDEAHSKYCNLVDSNLHHLSDNLESNEFIDLVHVNPNRFERQTPFRKRSIANNNKSNATLLCSMWFLAIEQNSHSEDFVQALHTNIQNFEKMISKDPNIVDLRKEEIEIEVRQITHSRLCFYLKRDDLGMQAFSNVAPAVTRFRDDKDERFYISKVNITTKDIDY